MFRETTSFLAILFAAGLVACTPGDRPGNEPQEEAADDQADKEQDAFARTAKMRIDDMEQQMDQVTERLNDAPEAVQNELKPQVADWKQQAADLGNRIDDFNPETPESQREFQARVNEELDELARTLNEHSQKVPPTAAR
jgi:hypothetical protein